MDPAAPIIILTAHGSIELAVEAIKEGADHFLTKPVELTALEFILRRLIENRRSRQQEIARASEQLRGRINPFLGTSNAIRRLAAEAAAVAESESPILIQGETGTGKGVLAKWLYESGPRANEPFVDLNCGGLSAEFLETELFGHEKGAFTGAVTAKPGLLEVAHRGTLFLDEIGDMQIQVQPKLLKVLEEKKFRRLGNVQDRHVDIRLISATHHNLQQFVQRGSFRSDLYFRISTIRLNIPPLRERAEDIPALARELLVSIGSPEVEMNAQAVDALQAYPWPGNIRELRNVLERAVLFSSGGRLPAPALHFDYPALPPTATGDASMTLEDVERQQIQRVLDLEQGQVGRAAERLGIPRSSLYQKIKRHRIRLSSRSQS
jgi:DNA-binding NtrC family response regulator